MCSIANSNWTGRLPLRAGLLLLLCAPTFACVRPTAEAPDGPPRRPLGTVSTALSEDPCPASQCITFEVESEDLVEPASGRIVVSEPTGEMRGTIIAFSGGGGTGLFGATREGTPSGELSRMDATMAAWSAAGFRLARVQWDENWWAGAAETEGFAALACRPATVTNWVAENLVENGLPLCVGGGSGGAGQVSYLLTHYGLEDKISLAVPWTGFWMGRIDLGCLDDDPRNSELHYDERARRAIDLSYGFSPEEDGPCYRRDEGFRSAFAEASISVDSDLYYPNTLVWHLLAGSDQVGALSHGLSYYDAMLRAGSTQVRADVLPGLPHGLGGPTDVGIHKIRDVFLQECVVR